LTKGFIRAANHRHFKVSGKKAGTGRFVGPYDRLTPGNENSSIDREANGGDWQYYSDRPLLLECCCHT
jgi:hypothetical protein